MDWIREKLSSRGALMALLGVVSAALYLFDYNVRALMWVDIWGSVAGWAIRGGLIVGGGLLFIVSSSGDDDVDEDVAPVA